MIDINNEQFNSEQQKTGNTVENIGYFSALIKGRFGLLLALVIGVASYVVKVLSGSPLVDSLLLALVIGVAVRSFKKFDDNIISGLKIAPMVLIPIGVVFYGAVNLDFVKFSKVDAVASLLLLVVFIVYIVSALILSSLFGIKDKAAYLVAAGSGICGASAIAVASPAIEAESDDVSVSLVAVFLSASIGLFIVFPLLNSIFGFSNEVYAILAGSLLQFTGFVKSAVVGMPSGLVSLALSVKAIRYTGLLVVVPLFSSLVKGRFFIPKYLWTFLGAGLLFSFVPSLGVFKPILSKILTVLWSIAMAAIGLNADAKTLATRYGLKVFAVSFMSFLFATSVFVLGALYLF